MAALAAIPLIKAGVAAGTALYGAKKAHDTAKDSRKAASEAAKKATPAPMPDEDELTRAARRRAAMRFGALGSGRASTILSNDAGSGKLGAG